MHGACVPGVRAVMRVRGRMCRRRPLIRLAVALVPLALATSACGLAGGGTYRVDVIFPRAVALFDESRVKVMGADVGTVKAAEIDGQQIRVELAIRDDVPIPADAKAAIVPFTLVGERNVVLTPPWKQGMSKLADGAEIPIERTEIPVEPDEALEAVRDIARALDPKAVGRLVSGTARSIKGRGKDFNTALESTAGLTATLAAQDEQLEEVVRNLHTLASGLNAREQKLGRVIDSFSRVSGVLAQERENIAAFLDATARLPREGQLLLANYQEEIPEDLATLAKVLMIAEANIDEVDQLVKVFPDTMKLIIDIWRPQFGVATLRVNSSGSTFPILALLGLDPVCIPVDMDCP